MSLPRAVACTALLLSAVVVWSLAGPTALGGGATYVTTYGTSMEPAVRAGDLVIVRAAPDYRVGDVVAYRSERLDTVVLHRIVDEGADGYIVKGDNNSWRDPERPAPGELIGRRWLQIPAGGRWLQGLTSPLAVGAAGLLLLSGGNVAARTRRRTKDRRAMAQHDTFRPRSVPPWLPPAHVATAGIAALGVAGALLGAVAWSRPASSAVTADTTVSSTFTFDYSASVPPSAAYDDTIVHAPQPVFRALTDDVEVSMRYQGRPGTVSIDVELATASGWRSTLRPTDPLRIDGGEHTATVHLRLSELQARADAAAAVIGLPAQAVEVAVVPTVSVDGGGVLATRLALTLDEAALRLPADQPLTVEETVAVTGTALEAGTLSLLGRSLPVHSARTWSVGILAAAALLALALAVGRRLAGGVAETERIRRRHGRLLLPVAPMALSPGRPVVDVPDVESLARLAERYGLLVLHWSRSGVDTYVVQDADTTYRHRVATGEPGVPEGSAPACEGVAG